MKAAIEEYGIAIVYMLTGAGFLHVLASILTIITMH